MKEIIKKKIKIDRYLENLNFLYGGNQLNFESTFEEIASTMDKQRKKMIILVNKDEEEKEEISSFQKSQNIICPKY